MERHNTATKTQMNAPTITHPNQNDVVCSGGHGHHFINHHGNVAYRKLVMDNLFNYKNWSLLDKRLICCKVYDTIVQSGGRFLKIVNANLVSSGSCSFTENSWSDGAKQQIQM